MGGISMWQLLIVLAIIILLFGTRKLPNLGSDLGKAIKGFKSSMQQPAEDKNKKVIDSTAEHLEDGPQASPMADATSEADAKRSGS